MMNSYSIVESINRKVNASVSYMSDSEQFGAPEWWSEARSGFDDCDGYALLKRELLKEQGFDAEKIHLATCWINVKADDTGHCVLIVETDKGQFVLDNRHPLPMTPKQCGYAWDKALDEVDGKWYVLSF